LKKNAELYPEDNLIREALRLEFESLEPLAAEKAWPNIEAALDRKIPEPKSFKLQSSWFRPAGLIAAACLILVLGGFGLFRSYQLSSPAPDLKPEPEFVAVAGDTEDTQETINAAEAEAATEGTTNQVFEDRESEELFAATAEEEPKALEIEDPVEEQELIEDGDETLTVGVIWPEQLGDSFLLEDEIILPAEEEERYDVAIYRGEEHDLLLVGSEIPGEEITTFIEKLGEQFNFPIKEIAAENGFTYFAAGGYSGLAFKQGEFYRAVLAPAETAKKEQLKEIAALFQ